jgi:hypothetical protein
MDSDLQKTEIKKEHPFKSATVEIKNCPNCLVHTQKSVGCNLIRCICKTKWCWECGLVKANKKFKKKDEKNKCNSQEHNSHS